MDILAAIESQESLAAAAAPNSERSEALDRYLGRPYGDEQEGRSQVVMRDVADTIEWIKPSLLKIFASGDEVCTFVPVGPEDEEAALQETEVVNHIVMQANDGFMVFHDWFHDALLQKTGYVLIENVSEKVAARETYRGLTDDEMALIGKDAEILNHTAMQAMTADGQPITLHDVTAQLTKTESRIKITCIPPEQVLVASDWPGLNLQGCPFLEIIDYKTVSDLRQLGYDVDDDINDEGGTNEDDDTRQRRNMEGDWQDREAIGADPATRRIRVRHVWIQYDEDEDGIAELRKLCVVGKTILSNEETDLIPVAAISPCRQPHEHYGMSLDDTVKDLQRIRTVLTRGFLDNMYLTNSPRTAIDANRVNLDDMLVSRPGGVIRVQGSPLDAMAPVVHQANGPAIIQAIEYIDTVRESRTGVTRYNQGLDANSLNKTATGITQIMTAAQQRIELIARIFAESGVKALMLIVHSMAIRHGLSFDKVRLRNKWVAVDPRNWKSRKDLTVTVGLGTGNKDQQLQHLMMILQAQKEALPLGLTSPNGIYNALAKLTQNAGFKEPTEFWTEPAPDAQMPTPPNPEMVKAQADQAKTQAQLQADAQKFQAQQQAEAQKFQAEAQLERERMAFDAQQKELDRQLELAKVQAQEATKLEIARMREETQAQTTMYTENMRAKPIEANISDDGIRETLSQGSSETAELIRSLQQTMAGLAEAMSRPKTILRGPDGRAIGVQ